MQDRITTKERGSTAVNSPSVMDKLTGLAKAKAGELLGQEELRRKSRKSDSSDATELGGDDVGQQPSRSKT